ncbi:MAG: transglycosylase domain-containing protein [Bdellovibrio sp.]|nr:transglycosylase domain-containing protein [Bdellovibrio sp.]
MRKPTSFGRITALICLFSFLIALAIYFWCLHFFRDEFPSVGRLTKEFPEVVYLGQGPAGDEQIEIHFRKRRPLGWVPLSAVSAGTLAAIVVSEDWAFYQHRGYDPAQMSEAIKADIRKKKFARGASTITQQVVKNLFLEKDKKIWRKIKELYLAIELEKALGKRKILEIYLNIAQWGRGVYGIGAASMYYFKKTPDQLTAREGAFLAMLLPSPVRYNQSFRRGELTPFARSQIRSILEKMVRAQRLSAEDFSREITEPLVFRNQS